MSVRDAVRRSLKELSAQLTARPFSILREAGLQAELRSLLLGDHELKEGVPIEISEVTPGKHPRFQWPRQGVEDQLVRVQLEMKILGQRDAPGDKDDRSPERVDLVVTKHPAIAPKLPVGRVRLTCYPNGPGDVVAAMYPGDVAAAIEIKASPSVDAKQRQYYRKDILRLLELAEGFPDLAAFFLVVDKSAALFGRALGKKFESPSTWRGPAGSVGAAAGSELSSAGLRLCEAAPVDRPYVEVWAPTERSESAAAFVVRA